MKYHISTTIEIEAPVDTVWSVLTDLDHYTEWNPFIIASAGNVAVGERLTNRMQNPGGKAMTLKPIVTEAQEGHVFEWLGRLVAPGIFDGRHRFELSATPSGGTRLVHSERFNGILVRLMKKSLDTKTLAGFEAMNAALKDRAEAAVRSQS